MLFDIPVQQFREGPVLLCRFPKESPFDDLDLDLPKNGLSQPFISRLRRSPELLALVDRRVDRSCIAWKKLTRAGAISGRFQVPSATGE